MDYQIRPGVVLTEACGEYLLLATLDASKYCPYVYQINETAAFFWRLLEKHLPEDEIVTEAVAEYGAPEAVIRHDIRQFVNTLLEQGYILLEEEQK